MNKCEEVGRRWLGGGGSCGTAATAFIIVALHESVRACCLFIFDFFVSATLDIGVFGLSLTLHSRHSFRGVFVTFRSPPSAIFLFIFCFTLFLFL